MILYNQQLIITTTLTEHHQNDQQKNGDFYFHVYIYKERFWDLSYRTNSVYRINILQSNSALYFLKGYMFDYTLLKRWVYMLFWINLRFALKVTKIRQWNIFLCWRPSKIFRKLMWVFLRPNTLSKKKLILKLIKFKKYKMYN